MASGIPEKSAPKSAVTTAMRPNTPSASRVRTIDVCGRKALHIASIAKTPAARAAPAIVPASAAEAAMGFSTSTCLPAAIAAHAKRACSLFGDETYTMSTAGSAKSAPYDPWLRGIP